MKKFIVLLSISLVIILTIIAVAVYQSKPLSPGTYEIDGLEAPVKIQRDKFGIPYIRAENKLDLYIGLGFVHAEDRIFQIDFLRRLVSGRLSEVMGSAALKTDKLFSQLRFVEHQKELRRKNPQAFTGTWFEELSAYVKGLNKFIQLGHFPIEYKLLSTQPKLFEIEELFAIGGYMAYRFAHGARSDAVFGDLFKNLKPEVFNAIWKTYPKSGPLISNPGAFKVAAINTVDDKSYASKSRITVNNELTENNIKDIFDSIPAFHGSNSWIISPSKSETGNAVLVNDPHIGYSNPSVWYEASLHCPDFKIQGHFLSGFPFALVGHGTKHAWALTMLSHDDMDLYIENIDWKTKKVQRGDSWIPLKEFKIDIPVKNSTSVSYTVTWSDIGPLIDPYLKTPHDKPVSLFWSYFDPENNIFKAFHGINNESEIKPFETALSEIVAPGLNISYANSNGDIAWWAAGRFIKREQKNPGHLPMEGTKFYSHPTSYYPFSSNPKLINPPQGYIITANNHPTGDDLRPGYYQPADRAARIEQLFQEKPKLSINDHKKILADSKSFLHLRIKDRLCNILKNNKKFAQRFSQGVQILCEWNGDHEPNEVGATLFQEWLVQLRIVLTDSLMTPKQQRKWLELTHSKHFLYDLFDKWNTGLLTLKKVSMGEAICEAFNNTLNVLEMKYGNNINSWTWGKVHTVTYRHPLGKISILNFLNLGPYPAPGMKDAINAVGANYSWTRFHAKSGPSTRRIVNLADINDSYSILPTGNSGNVFSPHYDDQVDMYLNKDFKRIPLTNFEPNLQPAQWRLVPKSES